MRYEGTIYRPPSEADSLLIQATIGCPHNKCSFCGMYKEKRFRIRKVEEIKKDLAEARRFYGSGVRSLFLPDGNTILMKTRSLLEIVAYAYELFPNLKRVTVYGSAKYIVKKTLDELRDLCRAGLTRIHTGMESGDDETLRRINKGTTAEEIIRAGQLVREAGMEQSEYYLVGVAGAERSLEHARASARVLNEVNPEFIRLRTYTPQHGTPLGDACFRGEFKLLNAHEAIRETAELVALLTVSGMVVSDHVSNYANISGRPSEDKKEMLAEARQALERSVNQFRPAVIGRL